MQCKDVELVLEHEGLEPLPEEARAHMAECRDCRNYIADLTSLVDAAKKLPPEITPPDRVWISLRAQLEEEGIIRIPADVIPADRLPGGNPFTHFSATACWLPPWLASSSLLLLYSRFAVTEPRLRLSLLSLWSPTPLLRKLPKNFPESLQALRKH